MISRLRSQHSGVNPFLRCTIPFIPRAFDIKGASTTNLKFWWSFRPASYIIFQLFVDRFNWWCSMSHCMLHKQLDFCRSLDLEYYSFSLLMPLMFQLTYCEYITFLVSVIIQGPQNYFYENLWLDILLCLKL